MALNPYESPRGKMRARAETSRRQFLMIMGGLAAVGASLLGSIKVLGFLFPQASGNAPALFKTSFTFEQLTGGMVNGKPVTPVNVLSETAKRVTVVLDDAGIYAVYLVCTHLGCTVGFFQSDERFHCPCHGSVFNADGVVLHGPAPRPLEWFEVTLARDGRLRVDKDRVVPASYRLMVS